jgi:hypothetical protein
MANPAPAPKALGTPPEPFDGAASKAETFLSALQNYYYLNEALLVLPQLKPALLRNVL